MFSNGVAQRTLELDEKEMQGKKRIDKRHMWYCIPSEPEEDGMCTYCQNEKRKKNKNMKSYIKAVAHNYIIGPCDIVSVMTRGKQVRFMLL